MQVILLPFHSSFIHMSRSACLYNLEQEIISNGEKKLKKYIYIKEREASLLPIATFDDPVTLCLP